MLLCMLAVIYSVLLDFQHKGIDLHATDFLGQTALHLISRFGFAVITRSLLAAGADPHLQNNDGRTPLEWATEADRQENIFLLEVRWVSTSASHHNTHLTY